MGVKISNNSGGGSSAGSLLASNNLSDLDDASTSRDNLGVTALLSSKKVYHGIESHGALSITGDVLTIAAATNKYWYKGTSYTTSSAITCNLDSDTVKDTGSGTKKTSGSLYWIYFKDATGTLYFSTVAPNLKEACPVATAFYNGSIWAPCDETHNHERDLDWHINAHLTIGVRYFSGLAITKPTTSFDDNLDLTTGYIYDEDNIITITNPTTCRIWYPAGAVYTFVNSSLPYAGDVDDPKYADGTGLTSVANNDYVAYWVYGSPDVERPIYIFPGSVTGLLATVRAQTPPALLGISGLTPELRLLHKFIYKGDGEFIESVDYRTSSSLPSGTIAAPPASSVTAVPFETIESTNVQGQLEEIFNELSKWTTVTFTRASDSTFTVTDNATNQAIFIKGRPIKYRATAGTWRHGIVYDYSSGTVTIAGAPLTTSDDDEMAYGDMNRVIVETFVINGRFADAANTTLLASDLRMKYKWTRGTSFLVMISHIVGTDDSGGAAQPRVNVDINGANPVSTSNTNAGKAVAETWTDTDVDISAMNYDINFGESLELRTDENGTNNDAVDVTVMCTFVLA